MSKVAENKPCWVLVMKIRHFHHFPHCFVLWNFFEIRSFSLLFFFSTCDIWAAKLQFGVNNLLDDVQQLLWEVELRSQSTPQKVKNDQKPSSVGCSNWAWSTFLWCRLASYLYGTKSLLTFTTNLSEKAIIAAVSVTFQEIKSINSKMENGCHLQHLAKILILYIIDYWMHTS